MKSAKEVVLGIISENQELLAEENQNIHRLLRKHGFSDEHRAHDHTTYYADQINPDHMDRLHSIDHPLHKELVSHGFKHTRKYHARSGYADKPSETVPGVAEPTYVHRYKKGRAEVKINGTTGNAKFTHGHPGAVEREPSPPLEPADEVLKRVHKKD